MTEQEQKAFDQMRKAHRGLIRAYVNLLESGRDRIISLGGTCDPVDQMEAGDPALREAKEAITAANAVQPQAQGEQRYLSIERVSGFPEKLETGPQPVLYSDSINGCMVRRDDVWLALTSHLNPQATEPAWRPIESAPKGAKGYSWMLLAWGPEEDKRTGYGMHADGKFYASATFYCLGQDRPYQMKEILVSPTHWMPLPAAPEGAKS